MGMNRFRNLTAWPVWTEVTCHIGNEKRISSLSIDRQLKFYITAWPQLGSDSAKNGNKSIKYTGSYFIAVKASSSSQWDVRVINIDSRDYMCVLDNTVLCRYNGVNFQRNLHKIHCIDMGCNLCFDTLDLSSASVNAVLYEIPCYIRPRYKGTKLHIILYYINKPSLHSIEITQ